MSVKSLNRISTTFTGAILTDIQGRAPAPCGAGALPWKKRLFFSRFFHSDIAIPPYFCYNLFRNPPHQKYPHLSVEKESDIMNKTELIKKVAAENGLSQKAAAAAVDSVLASISDSLAAREPVTLIGFGTFTCRHRDARVGRNPATGKKIKIAASNTPIFKAGKAFKEKVN